MSILTTYAFSFRREAGLEATETVLDQGGPCQERECRATLKTVHRNNE